MLSITVISALFYLTIVWNFQYVASFSVARIQSKVTTHVLSMGGGRSPAERGMSKRNMFKELRSKLNEAAKMPGFFEVGEGPPEIELYCKSTKDGKQINDCPFSQFVQKGIRYAVHPTIPSLAPEWLTNQQKCEMPAIKHKDLTLVGHMQIAEYLEKAFPHSSLTRQGVYSYQEVLERTAGFWPALSAFLRNKDAALDDGLGKAVEEQLDIMNDLIRSTPGYYICGMEMTLADLYLTPQLFHATIAMNHFKHKEVLQLEGEPKRPSLEAFMTRMFNSEDFNNKKAYYTADQVIHGWKLARGD